MLQRFSLNIPDFLRQIETRLTRSLSLFRPGDGLLSVTLVTPELFNVSFPGYLPGIFYWARPADRLALLGVGTAASLEFSGSDRWSDLKKSVLDWRRHWRHLDADKTGFQPLALGGFSYAPHGGGYLPAARLSVPDVLLRRSGDICALTVSFAGQADIAARIKSLEALLMQLENTRSGVAVAAMERASDPDFARWQSRVQAAVEDIHAGLLDKVVLTRSLHLHAEQDFDPVRVMDKLAEQYAGCTQFAVETANQGVFLGASPEMLVSWQKGEIACDALAGTSWQGETGLLSDVKNGREHRLVVQALTETLRALCSNLEVPDAPKIHKVGHLHHIRSILRGRAKRGLNVFDFLPRIHPTPAVGGYPRQTARIWLDARKEQRPGWYTGGVGWLDARGNGEFAVALRCAHLHGKQAELYAGAGIVTGSDARREWEETEAKMMAVLRVL
jgi:isochorismate synthase